MSTKKIIINKEHFLRLHDLGWLNYAKIASAIWPETPANQGSAKLRNKLNGTQGKKMTDENWELIIKRFGKIKK